ncbi:heterokaryon incompatibility protein-domain-containing protein, partial [Pyrenochaeta sp. MPI-SDFR-AT-0127]
VWQWEGAFGVLQKCSQHDQRAPQYVDPKSVDYTLLQHWLHFCKNHSKITCNSHGMQSTPGFKVIDCRTKCVVEIPQHECHYVALSYVWSSQALSAYRNGGYLKSVEDFFEACLALGLNYLWVDVYCINQQNAAEKRTQINMMDCIHSQAQLNIIAAVGKDPSFRLSGIGSTPRN